MLSDFWLISNQFPEQRKQAFDQCLSRLIVDMYESKALGGAIFLPFGWIAVCSSVFQFGNLSCKRILTVGFCFSVVVKINRAIASWNLIQSHVSWFTIML